MAATWVVVLAGGESRRFGSDKLVADLDGRPLLDVTLESIPPDLPILVVGPERPVRRPVKFVREEPPGGGPCAGLVAGLTAALADGADVVATLPGDAPASGSAIDDLLAALEGPDVVVALGADGQVSPLQLACTAAGAREIVAVAGPARGAGASVRRLLASLDPVPARVLIRPSALQDIDLPSDLGRIGKDPTG